MLKMIRATAAAMAARQHTVKMQSMNICGLKNKRLICVN
jgi:hypothetical protein